MPPSGRRLKALSDKPQTFDQGVEHSAGASFAPNPIYFDPENIIRLAINGGYNAVVSTVDVLGAVAIGATVYFGSEESRRQILEVSEALMPSRTSTCPTKLPSPEGTDIAVKPDHGFELPGDLLDPQTLILPGQDPAPSTLYRLLSASIDAAVSYFCRNLMQIKSII